MKHAVVYLAAVVRTLLPLNYEVVIGIRNVECCKYLKILINSALKIAKSHRLHVQHVDKVHEYFL